MTSKNLLTLLLLLFAAGSAAYVVLGKPAGNSHGDGGNVAGGNETEDSVELSVDAADGSPRLIVYYMDMGKDCTTCLNLENYTYTALETGFPNELAAGDIVWRTIDLDNPVNEHFIAEFGLYTKSVVLVRMEEGEQVRFDSLSRIWELVYDKEAYIAYIREQVSAFLDGSEAPA